MSEQEFTPETPAAPIEEQPNSLLPTDDQPSRRRPESPTGKYNAAPPMAPGMTKHITCTINGRSVSRVVDVRENLADFLRTELGLTSVKKGCEVGECGACAVLIDGEAMDSCIYLATWIDGKTIQTTEGLAAKDGALSDVQQAFVDATAVQCGFCTPGLIMTATEIVAEGEQYDREELRKRLAGNLCRCTGYENILNAVELAQAKAATRKAAESDQQFWSTVSQY